MEIRVHHFFALLCSAGLISAMAGCAPEETGAITEDGTESVAVPAEGTQEPGTQPETWNGQCCRWVCSNLHGHVSTIPGWGECQSHAANWCINNGQGTVIDGSPYWGPCS